MADQSKKDDAQAQFARIQRAEDGKKAMAEYEAAAIATRAKTERLRALRLARDAELAKKVPPKPARKKKPAKAEKAATGKLSEWLEEQQNSGRRR